MKRLLVHVFLGLLFLSGTVYITLLGLEKQTLHGQTILVPDLKSYSIFEVEDKQP